MANRNTSTDHIVDIHEPVASIARTDYALLRDDLTIGRALDDIRSRGLGERILYFYVVDADERLVGVLPTRRLLVSPLDQRLSDIMIADVITIRSDATIIEAHQRLAENKLLALPIVDDDARVIGLVDVSMLTGVSFDINERDRVEELFELIGFRVMQVCDASPVRAFRYRFPWLTATIGSGLLCAMLAGVFEATLSTSIILAFFLTLVLGLGESVSMQSMTMTIQALRAMRPNLDWYMSAFWRELRSAFLLGAGSGTIVGAFIWLWHGKGLAALSVGGSILLVIAAGCLYGLSIPTLLHRLRLDPKIAAGPLTLAITDISTILFYLGLATVVL
ncbi:MAG TPA: magnesium transporter [Spirochaetota bacterium]|nr:magnesium transporter [Spirochaetota bacterium]HNT11551.1 magnesium transporter [Spirochaetota bacterium]HNV45898.1 magnesium transporter [Spirochaetota bacterium]HOS40079.1 magnesium transporter [Spirochaetota bacterium]HPI22156.1 magnesium transporter [Spirochaetota bacterium]